MWYTFNSEPHAIDPLAFAALSSSNIVFAEVSR